MSRALDGLRVIDLGRGRAGPFAAKLLADYGASVTTIETPGRGEPGRRIGPFAGDVPRREGGGEFLSLHTNRKMASLDLESAAGRRLLGSLLDETDVVIENFVPGELARLGLDVEALWRSNAALVVTSISDFGQTGPGAGDPASELGVFLSGGARQDMGTAPRRPIGYADGSVSYMAAAAAAAAALAGLTLAAQRGSGVHVDLALQEVLLGVPNRFWLLEQFRDAPLERGEGRRPFTYYHCADGYACVSPGLGLPGLLGMLSEGERGPPEFQEVAELDALVAAWCVNRDRREVVEIGQRHHVMTTPVNTVADLIVEPGLIERGFMQQIALADDTILTAPGAPVRLVGSDPPTYATDGALGGDNAAVFAAAGTPPERLPALRRAGIV